MPRFSSTKLCSVALNDFFFQAVLMSGVALTQLQNLAFELHERVLLGPVLKLVPLDGIPSFCCVNCTAHLCVICKLAAGALDLPVCVTEEDLKEHWSQDTALRNPNCQQPPYGQGAFDQNSLAESIQAFSCLSNSPLIKSTSLQFGDKHIMWDHFEDVTG